MRHQYTRAELESITQETAIYIEGTGIAQLQWGGLEIAEGCKFETKRYERGEHEPTISNLLIIAKYYNVSLGYFD